MNCINVALRDFVFVWGLILCVLGCACLFISIVRGRAARLGDELLDACGYDDETVQIALANIRRDEAIVLGKYRERVSKFHDEDVQS